MPHLGAALRRCGAAGRCPAPARYAGYAAHATPRPLIQGVTPAGGAALVATAVRAVRVRPAAVRDSAIARNGHPHQLRARNANTASHFAVTLTTT